MRAIAALCAACDICGYDTLYNALRCSSHSVPRYSLHRRYFMHPISDWGAVFLREPLSVCHRHVADVEQAPITSPIILSIFLKVLTCHLQVGEGC